MAPGALARAQEEPEGTREQREGMEGVKRSRTPRRWEGEGLARKGRALLFHALLSLPRARACSAERGLVAKVIGVHPLWHLVAGEGDLIGQARGRGMKVRGPAGADGGAPEAGRYSKRRGGRSHDASGRSLTCARNLAPRATSCSPT